MRPLIILVLVVSILLSKLTVAQTVVPKPWDTWAERNPSWVEPLEPFKIIGNVYYVGTKGIASYLITSEEGHILIDGGMPQNARLIAASIQALGFKLKEVKILLNSHAHFDHSGGLAELKELSNAKMIASQADREGLETGLYVGSDDIAYSAPPVVVDEIISNGEEVILSTIRLKANITPGHTPGCTSWTMSVCNPPNN